MEQVRNRSKKIGNLKALSWQELIDIASEAWNEVNQDIIVRAFELTGSYGVTHLSF
jgi:hypothetical protein